MANETIYLQAYLLSYSATVLIGTTIQNY